MKERSSPVSKRSAPKNRAAPISLARRAAFSVLLAVERGHGHSDDLLRGDAVNVLSAPDRGLATALVLGVLRWQIQLDHQLQSLLKRPGGRLESEVHIALRLGAFQLMHMDRIPARAAIDESVELTKQAGHRFASAMVNAVLRKLASTPRLAFAEDSEEKLALAQSHPVWLVERWVKFYGFEVAQDICRHGQAQPGLVLRIAGDEIANELTEAGVELDPGKILKNSRIAISGEVAGSKAFLEGRIRFQDEGSQLIAEIAGQAARELCRASGQPSPRILDACAAPGGKTMILAERVPQGQILACESNEARHARLQQRLTGFGDRIECRLADVTQLPLEGAFDLVLADVPCSGTGTLGRNPEIRDRLQPEDFKRQAARQREILAAALRLVRPGGRVVYSTCSLEPEENEEVVAAVLASTPGASLTSLNHCIESLLRGAVLTDDGAQRLVRMTTPEGALRLFPGQLQTDGFYAAMIQRDAQGFDERA